MPGTIDLRSARESRAAKRELDGGQILVPLTEQDTLRLPAELPMDALAPVRDLSFANDFGGFFQLRETEKAEQFFRDFLTVHPDMVTSLIDVATRCVERLLCDCGRRAAGEHVDACQWFTFVAWRPTPQDLKELVTGLWVEYGSDLGEWFASSGSPGTGGETSKPTSNGSTDSTRATAGETAATPAS